MNDPVLWTIEPLGDRALIVDFGPRRDDDVKDRVRGAARALMDAALVDVLDVVPAFTTVTLHVRPARSDDDASLHDRIRARVADVLDAGFDVAAPTTRVVEIPVCYDDEYAPDLEAVAAACGLAVDDVISRHQDSPHVVEMLGFAPGFPYIGGLDERLGLPRRPTPRTRVPIGSVGIANAQSVIYPLETPGGWNLIGRTPLALFVPDEEPPCLLRPGDAVRFVRIDAARYRELAAARVSH